MKRRYVYIILLCIGVLSWQQAYAGSRKLRVVCTLFPLYDFARNVGQEKVEVSLLLPPGVEAHSFEPKPRDIVAMQKADVLIYTGKAMEPWVEDVVNSVRNDKLLVIDASQGITLLSSRVEKQSYRHGVGNKDPHIWLDFTNAQKMVDTIADGFIRQAPDGKDFYLHNASTYKEKLEALDARYRQVINFCRKKVIIQGGHFAFGYLARRYGLTYIAAYEGAGEDIEPKPKDLIDLIQKVKKYEVKYVYYEELVQPKAARTLAEETGTGLLKLSAAHNVTRDEFARGVTFLAIMEQNLDNLKKGLECQSQQ